jgi:hypothetical protein
MKFSRFELTFDLPGRRNIWGMAMLLFMLICLVQGVASTRWMASRRLGDSIIPREHELTRMGPFSMSEIRIRNTVLVRFTNQDGTVTVDQNASDFDVPFDDVLKSINSYPGIPIAYLSMSEKNPINKIWGVDVNGINFLSYKGAVLNYRRRDSLAYSWFGYAIIAVFFCLISVVNIRRVAKWK